MPPVWPAELARSLCKPSRGGTCHVSRASCTHEKYKITRPPVGSIPLKIWCECTAPFSRQTPESSTDRQREGRQKMPTYLPSINLRNTKNHAYELSFVFLRFWIIALKTSKIQRPMPSVNIFTKKHASYRMHLHLMDLPGE